MLGVVVLHRFHPFCASSALYVTHSSCSKGSVKISVINTIQVFPFYFALNRLV